jgi:hypothetical protein
MVSSDVFATGRTAVTGNTWTSEEAVLAAMAVPAGQNVFTLDTTALESRLTALPAIRDATVTVALPDGILVDVAEREALVAWRVGERQFLVDEDGFLFGEVPADAVGGSDALPVIDDRRAASRALGVGATLDGPSLDAAFRLGSLRPSDVGSTGDRLTIRVDDENGFIIRGRPADWSAIFGFYTPTLRPTDIIPGQVRLLKSLIYGREEEVLRVILADERSGTYVPRPTPRPSRSPTP